MTLLINRDDIALYRQISESVNQNLLNAQIQDAQIMDIQRLMGIEFFNDLIINSTSANYLKLLDPGTYVYDGTTYSNPGLKAVLVHYTYAKYILFGSAIDTPFSLVTKNDQSSEAASESTKKMISKTNQQVAYVYWQRVEEFLNRNADDYPLWGNCITEKTGNFRISKIG